MTREQLIKARGALDNSVTGGEFCVEYPSEYQTIMSLINNALDEPIEGLREAVAFFSKGDFTHSFYMSALIEAARRQLNQGGTK